MDRHEDRMVSRIEPVPRAPLTGSARSGLPPFSIMITASDGTELLRLFEDARGFLQVEGDEARWGEAAMRFLHSMMQWSGQVGIPWRDEVKKTVGDQR